MLDGIITKGIGGFYYVLCDDVIYECKARGVFRKKHITPLVGDKVKIEVHGKTGNICEISKRSSELVRPPVANIDTLVIVISALNPEPNLTLVDKMLVQAEKNNITPVICINKIDLGSRDDIEKTYSAAGYRVIKVSAENRENLSELYDLIKGKVTAFSGLSGVGKSSLLNAITSAEMETGKLSDKIQRGKNTTRHVELIKVQGGFVLDTPGFSSFEQIDVEPDELSNYFPEFSEHSESCKFRGCVHTDKQNFCGVKDAVANGKIPASRYESYCEIYDLLCSKKSY